MYAALIAILENIVGILMIIILVIIVGAMAIMLYHVWKNIQEIFKRFI